VDLDYAILADGVQHRPDGKLDMFGAGFDTVYAPTLPAPHPRLAVALRLLAPRDTEPEGEQIVVTVEGPDGTPLARAEGTITADLQRQAHRAEGQPISIGAILNFETVVFRAYGEHRVVMRLSRSS
jgi:hypothetical protein